MTSQISVKTLLILGASGDLTGSVTITGADAIGRLGDGLQTMFENLRRLLKPAQFVIHVVKMSPQAALLASQQL